MSNTILYRAPFGIPGDLSRPSIATVVAQAFNASLPFASYGIPGKLASGLFVPVSASSDVIYGFLVRPYPTTGLNASDPLGTGVPLCTAGSVANAMARGFMNVVCNAGTPAAGGAVYVRYANGSGPTPIGGIEATAVGGSNVAITNANSFGGGAFFTGPADANGNVEIQFNL